MFGHLLGAPLRVARTHGKCQVAFDREPGQQRVALEHHAAIQAGAVDFALVHEYAATGGFFQAGHHVQDGALATAGVADHADELALADAEVHVLEHRRLVGTVALAQVLDHQEVLATFSCGRGGSHGGG